MKEENLPAMLDFESDSGQGLENVTQQDLAIPILSILADLSPQVKKIEASYIQGAEPGMILHKSLNEVYDGKAGILFVPCYYQRRLVEWKQNRGGFVGSYDCDDPLQKKASRDQNNNNILPNGNVLENTAYFFGLMLHATLGPQQAVISMAKTQLKKSRKWLSQIQTKTATGAKGIYVKPMYSQIYRLKTLAERNDKGSWYGWEVSHDSEIADINLYGLAKALHASVKAGDIKVKHEQEESWGEEDDKHM
jgi:hypothetical protein